MCFESGSWWGTLSRLPVLKILMLQPWEVEQGIDSQNSRRLIWASQQLVPVFSTYALQAIVQERSEAHHRGYLNDMHSLHTWSLVQWTPLL